MQIMAAGGAVPNSNEQQTKKVGATKKSDQKECAQRCKKSSSLVQDGPRLVCRRQNERNKDVLKELPHRLHSFFHVRNCLRQVGGRTCESAHNLVFRVHSTSCVQVRAGQHLFPPRIAPVEQIGLHVLEPTVTAERFQHRARTTH